MGIGAFTWRRVNVLTYDQQSILVVHLCFDQVLCQRGSGGFSRCRAVIVVANHSQVCRQFYSLWFCALLVNMGLKPHKWPLLHVVVQWKPLVLRRVFQQAFCPFGFSCFGFQCPNLGTRQTCRKPVETSELVKWQHFTNFKEANTPLTIIANWFTAAFGGTKMAAITGTSVDVMWVHFLSVSNENFKHLDGSTASTCFNGTGPHMHRYEHRS